jgi:iron(III) transport system permease protein
MYLAYIARFLAVAFNPVDSNMHRITRSIDEAALGFGVTGMAVLRSVHLPILRAGLWTALALTFVDLMKELPITLMTRPFGWETLAVRVFEMTSEGEWERAALPAVAIVITGLIPVAVMARRVDRAS